MSNASQPVGQIRTSEIKRSPHQSMSTPSNPYVDIKESKDVKNFCWLSGEAARSEKVVAVG